MAVTTVPVVMRGAETGDPVLRLIKDIFLDGWLQGRFKDRIYTEGRFEEYCHDVTVTVPPDQLLDYSVSQGWAPLCRFLGHPEPDEPFPAKNTREQFLARNRIRE